MEIFIYESVCGGDHAGQDLPSSLASEGWKMLSSIVEDAARVHCVRRVSTILDRRFAERASAWGPKARVAAWRDRGPDAELFAGLAAAASGTIIIAPETGGALAGWSRAAIEAGGRLLGSWPDAVDVCGDKLALAEVFRAAGIPTPSLRPVDLSDLPRPGSRDFPVILKPRFGAGCLWTYKADSAAELHRAAALALRQEAPRDMVLGPYAAGMAASASFLICGGEVAALAPGRQGIEGSPQLRYTGGSLPLPTRNLCRRASGLGRRAIAAVPGLQGFVGVDVVLGADGPGGDTVIEINPRLTTSYLGLRRVHESWDIARQWIERCLLEDGRAQAVDPVPWNAGNTAEFLA